MIKVERLSQKDIGRWVEYRPNYGEPQKGRLKSWREGGVYRDIVHVVYKCDEKWDRFSEYAAVPTFPEDLCFCEQKNE